MTTYFISRHPGAIEWAARQKLAVDRLVSHLDTAQVQAGDTVIGSLPVNLAAQVCAAGATYWHLSLELPAALRGQELSADDLESLCVHLEPFHIIPTGENQ
ncbi:MAG: CRISPR-associated protein Csx16 [Rhodoferax sp.]|nr:CRISPR-associated protein Csx16 [Rhodoferax sp.]